MSESIAVICPEVPKDIVEAAEKVSNWFKQQGFGRWELAGCADRNHYISLKATARLAVNTYQCGSLDTDIMEQHLDELDNLLE